jgi:hypothetical protein
MAAVSASVRRYACSKPPYRHLDRLLMGRFAATFQPRFQLRHG